MLSLIGVGLRLLAHRKDIERLVPQVIELAQQGAKVVNDLKTLGNQAAPELMQQLSNLGSQTGQAQRGITIQQFAEERYDVKWLQQSLNTLMGTKVQADGIYGERTMAAVRAFQERYGLVPDGWAGVNTESRIVQLLDERKANSSST